MKPEELSDKSWRKIWKDISQGLGIKPLNFLHLLKMEWQNSDQPPKVSDWVKRRLVREATQRAQVILKGAEDIHNSDGKSCLQDSPQSYYMHVRYIAINCH